MGKKYIVEIGRLERLYKASISAKGMPNMTWLSPEVDLTPYTEPDLEQVRKEAYKEGREAGIKDGKCEAWEAARTLWNTPNRKEIFGYTTFNTVLTTLTAQETIEKIRQYEQEKEDFKVGDEVISDEDVKGVTIDMDDYLLHVLDKNGVVQAWPREDAVKTGRHFSEIAEVLQKMKENNDNK